MAIWFHSAVLATTFAATAAIGFAAAAVMSDRTEVSAKGDRLPIEARCSGPLVTLCAPEIGAKFMTVENRSDGVSVLTRVPVAVVR